MKKAEAYQAMLNIRAASNQSWIRQMARTTAIEIEKTTTDQWACNIAFTGAREIKAATADKHVKQLATELMESAGTPK